MRPSLTSHACLRRACLRKGQPEKLHFSAEQLREYSRHGLTWTAPLLRASVQALEEEEVRPWPVSCTPNPSEQPVQSQIDPSSWTWIKLMIVRSSATLALTSLEVL